MSQEQNQKDPINPNDFAFEVSIPMALLLDKTLDPGAIQLYAFIKGLTKAHGYCFATNDYLAKLMGISLATVKRLLKMLKDGKYLEIRVSKNGIHWQRHIYLGVNLNKCLRRLKSEPPPAQICTSPSSNLSHIYNKEYIKKEVYNKERESTISREDFSSEKLKNLAPQNSYGSNVKLGADEYNELVAKHGEVVIRDVIEEINDYIDSKGLKPYKNYAATIRNWLKRRKRDNPTNRKTQYFSNPGIAKHFNLNSGNTPRNPALTRDFSNEIIKIG